MNFLPVQFDSARKVCPLPLAVTVERTHVKFRISKDLVAEGKISLGDLYSIYYDDGASLFAIVGDPENKSGNAKKFLASSSKKNASKQALNISFPRTDLLARIWKKEAKITGIPLFEKRGPGKIVFYAPGGNIENKGGSK